MTAITLTLNGKKINDNVEPNCLLVDYIRIQQKLTGTHVGCEVSQCGMCIVHVNGKAIKSCTMLAVEADGCDVLTIEGCKKNGKLHPVQKAFYEQHGLQCGFCTSGMIMCAIDILRRHPNPSQATIRKELEGNFCRCTGYQNIVLAIEQAAKEMHQRPNN